MVFSILAILMAFAWLTYETRGFTIRLVIEDANPKETSPALALPAPYSHRHSRRGTRFVLRACVLTGGLLLIISFLSPTILKYIVFRMPGPSENFDCDDGTLLMIQRLSQLGITATPILGKLDIEGETYSESDHIWVLADVFGLKVALDWGTLSFCSQHYEGYTVTLTQLLEFVEQDRKVTDRAVLPASP